MNRKNREEAVEAAGAAVRAYLNSIGQTDPGEAMQLGDLLCDLRHYADEFKLDWNEALSYAYRHFAVEGGRADNTAPQTPTAE